jgi:putative NIF3 family GTP cyclohydrolase 1 type 2
MAGSGKALRKRRDEGMKIQNIIDYLTAPGSLSSETTVDRLLYGSPETEVTGVAVAFIASHSVIDRAGRSGANLLLTHEGLYYSHHAEPQPYRDDPVQQAKSRMLEQGKLAVYRYHDGIHRSKRDGIMEGLLEALEWETYAVAHYPAASVLEIPDGGIDLEDVAAHVKQKLGLPYLRLSGDLFMSCRRIGVLAGYRGGGSLAIPLFEAEGVDLIVYGEGPEWETPEYVRDAIHQGRQKGLLVLGHAESEAPGMRLLAERIRREFPDIPVHYLEERPVFTIV